MDVIYKIIEEYHSNKNRKILIVFDDTIASMLSNKRLNPIGTVFIIQPYFAVPKNIRLNSTHCFIMQIPSKRQL